MDDVLIAPEAMVQPQPPSDVPTMTRPEHAPPDGQRHAPHALPQQAPVDGDARPGQDRPAGGPENASATLRVVNARQAPLARIIEALLFASDAPLNAAKLAELVGDGITTGEIKHEIAALNEIYEQAGLSFRVEAIARGYQMLSLPQFRPWIARLNQQRTETRLSGAALETLSIVAYKQPVIRADVEAIRGVACGEVITRLREMGLVRVVGRAEVVGRPLLYGTTRKFLDVFGLADLKDLPPMEALNIKPVARDEPPVEPPAEGETAPEEDDSSERRAVAGA